MVNQKFADALAKLRARYKLTQEKIANIAGIKQPDYGAFERFDRKLGLDDADNISFKVWGVSYNKFIEFSGKKIDINTLPLLTQKAIKDAEDVVVKDKNNLLAKELDRLIKKGELNSPKTSKHLLSLMTKKLQKKNSTEITNLLNKKPRNEFIEKLKHGYKGQNLYVHKDFLKEFENLSIGALDHKIKQERR